MIAVDTLTPGYYCTLPRNMARRHKQPGQHQPRQLLSRNNSVEGSMDQVQYSTVQYSTVQYSTVQYSTV